MRNLIQKITLISILVLSVFTTYAQAAGSAEQQPTTGQKFMFYGLTGAGLLLLYLSFRQSKWGKKK